MCSRAISAFNNLIFDQFQDYTDLLYVHNRITQIITLEIFLNLAVRANQCAIMADVGMQWWHFRAYFAH